MYGDGKPIPPPPSTPLPLAPGEHIYAELGEKKAPGESEYLEPVTSSKINLSSSSGEKRYEDLIEGINNPGYETMNKPLTQPDYQNSTENSLEKQKQQQQQQRNPEGGSVRTPKHGEDEHGYLKMK